MGLRAMHEASKQSSTQESSLQLIEEQSQTIAELQQRVSELSSENSELMNELRSKSEMIKSLNEKIGTLSESDKVLKQNAELKQLNEQLRKEQQATEQRAGAMVLSVKEEYARKERQLAQTQAAADRARAEAEATRSQQAELVKEKAAQAYSSRKEALEREYQGKTLLYQTFLVGCLLYGLLTTVFTAVRSTRFRGDFIEFFTGLWSGVCWLSGAVWELGQAAAGLGDKIPQPVAAAAVHWLLPVLVVGGIAAAVGVGLFWGIKLLLDFYKADYADIGSLAAALIALAVAVFFAEPIRDIVPINLILLLILVHAAYIGVRWYVTGWKRARGYY